jgi:hypothetical protein
MAPKKAVVAPKSPAKSPKAAPKVAAKVAKPSKKAAKEAKADKPKRAPGPYMIFCKSERPKIVAKSPTLTFGEVGKALGLAWGKLTDAEKAKFKQ